MDLCCKVISLLFNMLSGLVRAFLPKSKQLLISWLQSPSAVILESKKIKSITISTVFSSICHEVIGLDAMILVFCMLSFKCWMLSFKWIIYLYLYLSPPSWLRGFPGDPVTETLCSQCGGPRFYPMFYQGTRTLMPQQRSKIPCVATKTWPRQRNT